MRAEPKYKATVDLNLTHVLNPNPNLVIKELQVITKILTIFLDYELCICKKYPWADMCNPTDTCNYHAECECNTLEKWCCNGHCSSDKGTCLSMWAYNARFTCDSDA